MQATEIGDVLEGELRSVAVATLSLGDCAGQVRLGDSIHIYRIENGKVAEHWAKRDDVGMAEQLGLFDHYPGEDATGVVSRDRGGDSFAASLDR